MKNKVRDADPDLADLINLIKTHFGIKAVAVKVGDEVIYRSGTFEPINHAVLDCLEYRKQHNK